jgi:hypothetical protein
MMNVQPLHRRITRRLPALWVAALLALACCGTALAAASASSYSAANSSSLAGKWKGHYSGAVSGHFTIRWQQTGTRLHGTITLSNPSGKFKFGAVSVGAKYTGKVRGTSMSGTWTSPEGGGTWSATKQTR